MICYIAVFNLKAFFCKLRSCHAEISCDIDYCAALSAGEMWVGQRVGIVSLGAVYNCDYSHQTVVSEKSEVSVDRSKAYVGVDISYLLVNPFG